MTNKLLTRPAAIDVSEAKGKYERFNLEENPFPSDPFVNKDSLDKRINGDIYEMSIREQEYRKFEEIFLKAPQSDPNHIRLGYIIEDSYVGRGNGKSAFLVNLQQIVNQEYCLDISGGANKCFALYIQPEAGGRTKTFSSFVDQIFNSIIRLDIILDCLAGLRLEAIVKLYPEFDVERELNNEEALKVNLLSRDWYVSKEFNLQAIIEETLTNENLQTLPPDFPLVRERNSLIKHLTSQEDFKEYYFNELKKGKDRYDCLFSHLVQFFLAAGFNGAFILVDDFERIPDFQSARQKRDFALELRSCLYDGLYTNARIGFYNLILVLHAGVQNMIGEAWSLSGMDHRAPISPKIESRHVIIFEKLTGDQASSLINKYLSEFRIKKDDKNALYPFTDEAVKLIGEMSELNASRILKTAYYLLEKAADDESREVIDRGFVVENEGAQHISADKKSLNIEDIEPENILDKATKDTK